MNNSQFVINSYLSFQLGEEIFAAHVGQVLEILEVKQITKIPKYPPYMKGVTNLRGTVLPIVDMRIKFGMAPLEPTIDTCIIVLKVEIENGLSDGKTESITIGAMVDAVKEVLEINQENILPPPSIGLKCRPDFINGVWKKDETFIMLLNINLIFSITEITAVGESTQLIE